MGLCYSNINEKERKRQFHDINMKNNELKNLNDKIINNDDIQVLNPRENENRTGHADIIPLKIINQVSKSICKIIYEYKSKKYYGTGFFMLVNNMKFLITNHHNINEDLINQIINIEIYNNGKMNIKLNY